MIPLVVAAACSGAPTATTEAVTTNPAAGSSASPTSSEAPGSTLTTTSTAAALSFAFRTLADTTDNTNVEISYPLLIHPDDAVSEEVNMQLEQWATSLTADFAATAGEGAQSTLLVQVAPELLNEEIFSVSGVMLETDGVSGTSISNRLAWIFWLRDGRVISAAELFADRSLAALAAAAGAHLIADVLGGEDAITVPGGLDPVAENFDAVWLTADGIGVGFDQFQVAAGEIGAPAVLVPFAELADGLDTSGPLANLSAGLRLPSEL